MARCRADTEMLALLFDQADGVLSRPRCRGGVGLALLRAADGAARHPGCTAQSLSSTTTILRRQRSTPGALFAKTYDHPLPPRHPTGARTIRFLEREILD